MPIQSWPRPKGPNWSGCVTTPAPGPINIQWFVWMWFQTADLFLSPSQENELRSLNVIVGFYWTVETKTAEQQ